MTARLPRWPALAIGILGAIATACNGDRPCQELQATLRRLGEHELEQIEAAVPDPNETPGLAAATRASIDRAVDRAAPRCDALSRSDAACVEPLGRLTRDFLTEHAACESDACRRAVADASRDALTRSGCASVLSRVYCRGSDRECDD